MSGKWNRPIRVAGWLAGLTLLAAIGNRVAAQQTTAAATAAVSEGARVYGNMCGRCHNPRSPLERSDRAWVAIVNHMRARGNLTGKEVRSVLAFLQATNANPAEAPAARAVVASGAVSTDPLVIALGKELVTEKACLGCHVIGDAGGQVGPALNGVVARRGADMVRHKLADPTFNNATSMMPNFGLVSDQIEAIVAFLNSLKGR